MWLVDSDSEGIKLKLEYFIYETCHLYSELNETEKEFTDCTFLLKAKSVQYRSVLTLQTGKYALKLPVT